MAICNNCNNEKKYYPHEKIQEGGLVQYIMYNLEAHKMYTAVISLSNCFKIVQDKVPICKLSILQLCLQNTKFSICSYLLCPKGYYKSL